MIVDWIARLIDRLLKRYGGLELLQLVLLFFTLESAALGLAALVTWLSQGFMFLLTAAALMTAWKLSRARLPGWAYALTGAALGALGLLLTTGRIGGAILQLLSSLVAALIHLLQGAPTSPSNISAAWGALAETFTSLVTRVTSWWRGMSGGTPVTDPLVIPLAWGMLTWLLVLWALWWTRKRASVLIALLPLVSLLSYNIFFLGSATGVGSLILSGGGMLALQACTNFGARRVRWSSLHMESTGVETRLALSVALLAVVMMLAGSLLPVVPVRQLAHALDTLIHPPADGNLAESLGIQQTPVSGTPLPPTPTPVYSASATGSHLIASAPEIDRSLAFLITVEGYSPPPVNEYASLISQGTLHYYWRSRTYDEYNGRTWFAGTARVDEVPPGSLIRPDVNIASLPDQYTLVTQHVVSLRPGERTVVAAGELLSLDQPSAMLRRETGEIVSVLTTESTYTALSRTQSPGADELRGAGTDYPASLRRHFALPESIPPRVIDLALNLTADEQTPYDKAAQLEAYLRQFTYSLDAPAPPSGQDAVDYFLFELKSGYCDYFASAMVVMARAAGLPARLVLGYSEGSYDPSGGYFVVRALNAHAWAEIYFPGFGWVEFEPTPNLPRPVRPGQTPESEAALNLPPPGREAPLSIHLERTALGRLIMKLAALLLLLMPLPLLPIERWHLSQLSPEKALGTIFQRLYRRGRSLGIPPDAARTPDEFALALSGALEGFGVDEENLPLIQGSRAELDLLTGMYTRHLFSERPLAEEQKQEAIRSWGRLKRSLRRIRR